MDWVTIDTEKCTDCGMCALRCPLCFLRSDGTMKALANENNCSLCGHCVALCPADAITHHRMDMNNFLGAGKGARFPTDEFIRFIRERRSHRHFKDKAIPRETLEKLVDICRYAPTGGNEQPVEVIVVQDPQKRQRLSDLTIDFFIEMGEAAEKILEEPSGNAADVMVEKESLQTLAYYKNRLSMARAAGFDPILYKAPATFIFHSPTYVRTPKDNCVIASTTMALTARTMGLESTYIGLLEMAAKVYQPMAEELSLPPRHEVYSVIIMGYPKLRFLKSVDRKPIKTRWE
jgi:nitroreductase/NAD-dependent dihydropyrimidine dehydrogenase PreA subunit